MTKNYEKSVKNHVFEHFMHDFHNFGVKIDNFPQFFSRIDSYMAHTIVFIVLEDECHMYKLF